MTKGMLALMICTPNTGQPVLGVHITFATALILFTSGYFGRLLGEGVFIREDSQYV